MRRQTISKALSKGIAVIAAASLALGMFGCSGNAGSATLPVSETIEEQTTALAGGEGLTIVANAAHVKSQSGNLITYSFPDLTVTNTTDERLRSITVQFTTAIQTGDDITLDVDGVSDKFALYSGNKIGNRSVNSVSADGLTAEEWQAYLREHLTITLNYNTDITKGLRMIANVNQVTRTLDYNSENGHYYELITKSASWEQARYEASQMSYLGLQGYLANITSEAENKLLGSLVNADTWIGASCWPDFISTLPSTPASAFNSSHRLASEDNRALALTTVLDSRGGAISTAHNLSTSAGLATRWYWVTGPEAYEKDENGKLKRDADGNLIYHPTLFCMGNSAKYVNSSLAVDPNDASKGNFYTHWNNGEPNNASGEFVAHVLKATYEGDVSNKYWNDYNSGNTSATAYLVEYGGLEDEDDDNPDGTVNGVNQNIDVYVKLDIDIDTSGRTITTSVDNVTVGDNISSPLPVMESVNGDLDIKKTNADGSTESVTPTRTYYIQDPTAEDGWREMTPDELNENGEPYHAGTYKLQSTAVNGYDEEGNEILYRGGSTTFKIKPKTIDLMDTETPLITKVYDGTTDVDGSSVDISSFVLPGAAVTLSADAIAQFDDVSVAKATKVALSSAALNGADVSDYNLYIDENGYAMAKAAILPRELVLTTSASVNWGLAGTELKDGTGAPIAYKTNLAIHGDGDWQEFELAARDAVSLQETILGDESFSALSGSQALNASDPSVGTYTAAVHFANVNPAAASGMSTQSVKSNGVRLMGEDDEEGDDPTAPEGEGGEEADDGSADVPTGVGANGLDLITATQVGDNRYDIGNYLLTLKDASVLVTDNPYSESAFDDSTDFIDKVVNVKVDPTSSPLSDSDILDLIKQAAGSKLPAGTPNIIITDKDGNPVDKIDPSQIGNYAIVATYSNPDGKDEVVRIEYNVMNNDPLVVEQEVTIARTDGVPAVTKSDLEKYMETVLGDWIPSGVKPNISITKDGTPYSEIDLSEPGVYDVVMTYVDDNGEVREVHLKYTVADEADYIVDENVQMPVDPNGSPLTPDDIVKRVTDTYPDLIPAGVDPSSVTITKDGKVVDNIDPTQPGTYDVTIVYVDPETGEEKVVHLRYTFRDDLEGTDDGTDDGNQGNGDGIDDEGNAANGSNGADGSGANGSGSNGSGTSTGGVNYDNIASRILAQTGDPVFLTVCGLVVAAVVAGVAIAVSRKRSKGKEL